MKFFPGWERMTTLIYGLHPTSRFLSARYCEAYPLQEWNFAQLVHYAQNIGEDRRARQSIPYEGAPIAIVSCSSPHASADRTACMGWRPNPLHPPPRWLHRTERIHVILGMLVNYRFCKWTFPLLQVDSTVPTSYLHSKLHGRSESAQPTLYAAPKRVLAPRVAFL